MKKTKISKADILFEADDMRPEYDLDFSKALAESLRTRRRFDVEWSAIQLDAPMFPRSSRRPNRSIRCLRALISSMPRREFGSVDDVSCDECHRPPPPGRGAGP